MEQIKKVKMAIKLGLTSILETFWAIGTSTVARDVLLIKKHENTTLYIANKADSGFLYDGSLFEDRRSFCFGYLKKFQRCQNKSFGSVQT